MATRSKHYVLQQRHPDLCFHYVMPICFSTRISGYIFSYVIYVCSATRTSGSMFCNKAIRIYVFIMVYRYVFQQGHPDLLYTYFFNEEIWIYDIIMLYQFVVVNKNPRILVFITLYPHISSTRTPGFMFSSRYSTYFFNKDTRICVSQIFLPQGHSSCATRLSGFILYIYFFNKDIRTYVFNKEIPDA